jgi:BASS family bile acid:Na+ symporter
VAPLLFGGAFRALAPSVAERITSPLDTIAHVALLLSLVLIIVLAPAETVHIFLRLVGTGTLLAFVAFVLGSIAIGWLVGGPTTQERRILALGTAARNVGISLFIAVNAFSADNADSGILPFTVLMLFVSVLVAWYWGRKSNTKQRTTAVSDDVSSSDS